MATATHRPLSPGMIALFGVAGAMLLGTAIARTTPTGMLERTADDWRSRVPQSSSSLAYVAVGSAPESVEFGRHPLDRALLAGEDMVLTDDHGRALLHPAATFVPVDEPASYAPAPELAAETATEVTVHRGAQSAKAEAEPTAVAAQPSEIDEPVSPVELAAVTTQAD
jgi:hypothetical protein